MEFLNTFVYTIATYPAMPKTNAVNARTAKKKQTAKTANIPNALMVHGQKPNVPTTPLVPPREHAANATKAMSKTARMTKAISVWRRFARMDSGLKPR